MLVCYSERLKLDLQFAYKDLRFNFDYSSPKNLKTALQISEEDTGCLVIIGTEQKYYKVYVSQHYQCEGDPF